MVTHTIEELHELFKSGELDVKEYYKELFEEAKKQQERLNAFVTITEEEAYNFQAYTKTKFFKYIYSIMKTDQNVPLKYLPFMPTYTHPWTDEMLYEYFGLTEDEVKEIEQEIK